MRRRLLPTTVVFVVLVASQAQGYIVPRALLLDELAKQCDLIVKGVALGSEPVHDAAFADLAGTGYGVFATRLKVISVLKGDATLAEITFHHYDKQPGERNEPPVSPQSYHFTPKQPYILFAKKAEQRSVFRTFTFSHTSQRDQGLIRAADEEPIARHTSVKAAIWRELTALASSNDSANIVYAIEHLNVLSGTAWHDRQAKTDFASEDALDVITLLLANKEPSVAHASLQAIGRDSPYLSDGMAPNWLATVGKGKVLRRGFATYPDNHSNRSAYRYRAHLVKLAQSPSSADIRALAIRALGRSRQNEKDTALIEPLRQWTADQMAPVRAAAAILWSDYPSKEATAALESLAGDEAPAVRTASAHAVGFSQIAELLPILDRMLADPDELASRAAALSLLSFDPDVAGPILKAHLGERRYSVEFTNALAEADPAANRDRLVAILKANPAPEVYLAGQMPTYTAWDILMKYVTDLDPAGLRAGTFDPYLDALETPPNVGSSPYQTLYRFYHDRRLTARMQSFKAKARAQVTGYDIDFFFKQIDGRK